MLNINGSTAAVSSFDYGTEYLSSDLLGSTKSFTDSYGSTKSTVSYDAFGSLIEGSLTGTEDTGYLGKPLDPATALYNYGYRDYTPATARFTTIDPIRDGTNWFTYCNSDPVNFVDLWGLEVSDQKVRLCIEPNSKYILQKETINNTDIDLEIGIACNNIGNYLKVDVRVFLDSNSNDNSSVILSRDEYVSNIEVNVYSNGKKYFNSNASNAYETGTSCIANNIPKTSEKIVVDIDINVIAIFQEGKDEYNYEVIFQ